MEYYSAIKIKKLTTDTGYAVDEWSSSRSGLQRLFKNTKEWIQIKQPLKENMLH